MGPAQRGKIIDRSKKIGNNLGLNFPAVDSLRDGVLTSTRIYNTTLKPYMDARKWYSKLKRDLNKFSRFTTRTWNHKTIESDMYKVKRLIAVLPNCELTEAQKTALFRAKEYAVSLGNRETKVELRVVITR